MTHSDRAGKSKVTIEALIQLKRCERPAPEFWDRFEQELRAKQLAAIVEKRPWWLAMRLPRAGKQVSRLAGPFTAVAALCAVGLMVVREYHPTSASSSSVSVDASMAAVTLADAESVPSREVSSHPSRSVTMSVDQSGARDGTEEARFPLVAMKIDPEAPGDHQAKAVANASSANVAATRGLMEMIPWGAAAVATGNTNQESSTVLGELPQVHFLSAILPEAEYHFDARVEVEPVVMPTRVSSVEPRAAGAQSVPVLSPREVRRNRILSGLVVADNGTDAERSRMGQVREVFASALDEDRLYDGVRRLGMGGDRLTLKF